jgi:predicted SAM-dependent methyltransferase
MQVTIKTRIKELVPSKIRRASHFGLRYKCPFCGWHLRTFDPYGLTFPVLQQQRVVGGGYRKHGLCPVCGSTERERLLYLLLQCKTDALSQPQKLLHVAPEAKIQKILQALPHLDYLTADLYVDDIDVKVDLTNIPFADDSFDAIICNHVFEHIIDDRRAMGELIRVLKPNGWAIVQVPISLALAKTYEDPSITTTKDREEAFGQGDHVRIYAKDDYIQRLMEAGFEVTVFDWKSEARHFGGSTNRFALNEGEPAFLVKKP